MVLEEDWKWYYLHWLHDPPSLEGPRSEDALSDGLQLRRLHLTQLSKVYHLSAGHLQEQGQVVEQRHHAKIMTLSMSVIDDRWLTGTPLQDKMPSLAYLHSS